MNKARIFQVLLAPHVSEKATVAAEKGNQFVFRVAREHDGRVVAVNKAWERFSQEVAEELPAVPGRSARAA